MERPMWEERRVTARCSESLRKGDRAPAGHTTFPAFFAFAQQSRRTRRGIRIPWALVLTDNHSRA